ncbi:MAG: hypothetical protein AB7S78_10325 [Candidatus Omnitrophota bacterium]
MSIQPESALERKTILDLHRKLILEIRAIEEEIRRHKSSSMELENKRSALVKQIEPLVRRYWNWIPDVTLSRCPFCLEKLFRKFDPVDFNGFWWMDRTQRSVQEPDCCEHFCLLSGAVDLNGHSLPATLFECKPGPQKSFVIPRILLMPAMKAVISSIQMECGFTAIPIVYFSEHPPTGRSLAQSWARKEYHFTLEDGKSGWDIVEDDYDFNLDPWVEKGKLIRMGGTI